MRLLRIAAPAFVGLLLIPLLLLALPPEPRKITVKARRYEFQPNRIELKAGEPVEITFESQDGKHGFSCKDLKLEKVVFTKDSPGKVSFTPENPGTYKFKCAHFCGLGHPKMKGEIVVTP
jgi:cytochrome c oxidase subunit 2